MKYVHEDDGLHDPAVRTAMTRLTGDGDTSRFEAAAAVRAATRAVERLRAGGAHGRALSPGAVDVLLRLGTGDGGVSIGELARAAGVSSRNVTGLVDTLAGLELVRRVPDPGDRRSVLVEITTAGQEWLAGFRDPATRAMTALFHGFTDADVARLRDLCLRLVVNQQAIQGRMARG